MATNSTRTGIVSRVLPPVLTTWAILGLYYLTIFVVRPVGTLPYCSTSGLSRLAHWDGGWYLSIATHGYVRHPGAQQPTAFFPLLPLLARLGHTLVPAVSILAVGIIVNVAAITGAMVLVDRIVSDWPRWQRLACVALLMVFPGAFFYGAFYSEALFMFGVALTLWGLKDPKRLWFAALGVCIASLDRSIGIVMVVPVAVVALRTRNKQTALAVVTASSAGIGLFGAWIVLADKIELFKAGRAGWRGLGGLSLPIYLVRHGFATTGQVVKNAVLGRAVTDTPLIGMSVAWALGIYADVVVVVALIALRKVREAERYLVVPALAIGVGTLLAGPTVSQVRFTAVLLPLWIAIIGIIRHHRAGWFVLGAAGLVGLGCNLYLAGQFTACRWAG